MHTNEIKFLNQDVSQTFEVNGVKFGIVDSDHFREVYELSTGAKMYGVDMLKVGNKINHSVNYITRYFPKIEAYLKDNRNDRRNMNPTNGLL